MTVRLDVAGLPPARGEPDHREQIRRLLEAARGADLGDWDPSGDGLLELEVVVRSPAPPPSGAADYLEAIAALLQHKDRRGHHLGELAKVELYPDEKRIQEAHFQWIQAETERYAVTVRLR